MRERRGAETLRRIFLLIFFVLIGPGASWALGPSRNDAPEEPGTRAVHVPGDFGVRKSYLVPALEVTGFVAGLNAYDRLTGQEKTEDGKNLFETSLSTFRDNTAHGHWGVDDDPFDTNQLGHPYNGSIYQGFARSAGLNFWESFACTFAGSFLWETAGERAPPSLNDQIASGIAGNFFGEPLFRMASLVLEGGGGRPGVWRELGAAALSPPTGFNRLVFGDRFKPVFKSHDPAYFWRFGLGESTNSHPEVVTQYIPAADFSMYYGLPGKEGYGYRRPFDYFDFRFTVLAHSKNPVENIMVSGLLFGEGYNAGGDCRGVWGLYGSYDYLSPRLFKASSTAVSLGTTAQWKPFSGAALQGSLLGGAGYGAAGIDEGDTRTYRYGTTFQVTSDLRLAIAGLAQVEAGAREYYVSRLGGARPAGNELIGRYSAGLTVRVYGRHALGFRYVSTLRDGESSGRPDQRQSLDSFSVYYTFLSDTLFGAVRGQ